MVYRSKKHPEVTARFDFTNEKYATTQLIYLTGPDKGKAFSLSNSTLKRWWEKVEDEKSSFLDSIDMEQVNTPYPEPKEQKYIPKPEAVIEYENKKRGAARKKQASFTYPKTYDELANKFAELNIVMKKVNKGYISLPDNSKIKILTCGIGVLASTDLGTKLSGAGLVSRQCIEPGTPFRYDINSEEEYNKLLEILQK